MVIDKRELSLDRRQSDIDKKDELLKSLDLIDKYIIRSTTNLEGKIIEVSQAFCDISGYTKDELIGQPHSIVRHPDVESLVFQNMWETIQSGAIWTGELPNTAKDGTTYWVDINIEPNLDKNGKIISYTSIRHKISNKKELESQLEQNNAIIQFAHSGIGTLDLEGNFLEVNDAYKDIFGYTSAEFIGKNCVDMSREDYVDITKKSLSIAREIGALVKMKKVCKHKDGSDVYVEFSLDMLPNRKAFVMIVNSLNDKLELKELTKSFENRVIKETKKKIEQLEVMQQERLKNIKLNTIGSLAAGITHEINTPLTYIKGNFEMIKYDIEDLPPSDIRSRMIDDSEKIVDGINRISSIVEAMREVSQTSVGIKKQVNIYNTLLTALTLSHNRSKLQSKIYINSRLFNLEIPKDLYVFNANVQPERIEQVWIIILSNALDELVKIENYEYRELQIDIYQMNNNLIIKFKDNAGGISKKILPKIIEPFVSMKQSGGIGIGLNIAYNIIQEHDGEIKAYNEDDGAVFEVRLKVI